MRYLLVLVVLLCGCGDGGDDNEGDLAVVAPTPTPLPPQYITCYHDGSILICDNQGNCTEDKSSTEEITEIEEVARGLYLLKATSGNVTILAECGANVYLSSTESTSYPAS